MISKQDAELGSILLELGHVHQEQIDEACELQKIRPKRLDDAHRLGWIISKQCGRVRSVCHGVLEGPADPSSGNVRNVLNRIASLMRLSWRNPSLVFSPKVV